MQILPSEITESGLARHACRAAVLFREQDFVNLVKEYGYAVANGRDQISAIQEDFEQALFGGESTNHSAVVFHDNPTAGVELQTFLPNDILIAATFSGIQVAQYRDRIAVFDLVVFGTAKDGYAVSIEDVYEHRFAA